MPRKVKEILAEMVFGRRMPVVFSSATLSVDGSFDYVAQSLGISDYLSFSVASPYNYEEQMKAILYQDASEPSAAKIEQVLRSLKEAEGGSLLLFPSFEELHQFQAELNRYPEASSYRFLYEGSAEISHLISEFQRDERSILCAVTLWEGLDIPGPSLSHVLIWSLPFPPRDPVFDAKRKDAKDAFHDVDIPYMLLRMRQGIGRLIRTSSDSGTVTIFGKQLENDDVREQITRFLPSNTERMASC
jgi:ATP-dependent DNA helicase DinG